MKNLFICFGFFLFVMFAHAADKSNADSSKAYFYSAYNSLKNMLEGKDSLDFEKAVFITENAFYDNVYSYENFKTVLDLHTTLIRAMSENARQEHQGKYVAMKQYEQKMFLLNTDNWAIFKYITDTTLLVSKEKTYFKKPFTYSTPDPYGTSDWKNTQVIHLLSDKNQNGNCYALAVLFKLFSDRLHSDARLTVAPHHIYIQNRNAKGDFCNVELATKSFPGDGSIQTLTYTTNQSIMNGMTQRMLSEKECVVLNLIYLAKGFQYKFNDNTDDFIIRCANLALKHDPLSLNALLLKAEVTENRLFDAMKQNKIISATGARANPKTKMLLASFEKQLSHLYKCGYREIPENIEQMILASIQKKNDGNLVADNTPNPFSPIGQKQRYATLSWGLFDEMHENRDTIQYYHASLNTKTKKIIEFIPNDSSSNYSVDPVVFAMSVDPLTKKFPELTPYQFGSDNPILNIDLDGLEGTPATAGPNGFIDAQSASYRPTNVPPQYTPAMQAKIKVQQQMQNVTPSEKPLEYIPVELDIMLFIAAPEAAATEATAAPAEAGTSATTEAEATSATSSLNPAQAKSLAKFEKKMPANVTETTIHDLPEEGKAFQATSPGKSPGSKAIYEKQVDKSGTTTQFTKTTYDKQGNIVHVKDKLTKPETTIVPEKH